MSPCACFSRLDLNPSSPRAPQHVNIEDLDAKRVYIGFLPEGVVEASVKKVFSGVVSVELRGKYGYVSFDSEASANAAITKNNTTVCEARNLCLLLQC